MERTTFKTSRLLDFCSKKELTAQIGHAPDAWPLVLLKELLDNAIDACEDAGTPPEVLVEVDAEGVTVEDNGPGIPPETIAGVVDFSIRVSSREAYVSPCRGAQGNALKTILAMPFVLDGVTGHVEITGRGVRHEITLRADRIRQTPVVDHRHKPCPVRTGTVIRVVWPTNSARFITDAKSQFLQIADDYTFLNPHLALRLDWFGEQLMNVSAIHPGWRKWLPGNPTSAHWYDVDRFSRLLAAYIAHDADEGRDRTIREFVAEFDGLTNTGKQTEVLLSTDLKRSRLSVLAGDGEIDAEAASRLLAAMKANSKPVNPRRLGVIGKEVLRKRMEAIGCMHESFTYKPRLGTKDGVPWVQEVAFGHCPASKSRRLITGINWSPGILNPFRELGRFGDSLDSLLARQRVGRDEPVVLLVHIACPRMEYTDRGKSAVVIAGQVEEEVVD